MGVQACRLPALKCLKRSKPLKRSKHLKPLKPLKGHINGTPRPDPLLFLGGPACRSPGICSQRAPKATSMASYGRPAQAKATPRPDPVLFLGGPACRSPGIRSQRASQGHINGFLWASSAGKRYPKARSIAFSGRSSVPLARHSQPTGIPRPHQWLLLGVQAKPAVCHALNASKASNRYKPGLKRFKGFKPLRASMASHGLPAQAKATPRPDPLLFHPKATSMASSGRPSLPFATP